MTLDTALPPALFDLEEPAIETPAPVVLRRRHGHQITITNYPSGHSHVRCTCGDGTGGKSNNARWIYAHLGIDYDTTINRVVNS